MKSPAKKRIVHVIYDSIDSPWLGGGGAHRTQEIYRRLLDAYDVTVLSGNFTGAQRTIDGVRYRRIGLKSSYYLSRLSFLLLAPYYAMIMKCDILIEDIGMPSPFFITALKKKCICSVQYVPNKAYSEKRKLIGSVLTKVFRLGVATYRNFVTVSEYSKNEIMTINPGAHVTVIPNGVNLPVLDTSALPTDFNYILYIGRIDMYQKGIDVLLDAIAKLQKDNRYYKLVIAGTGEKDQIQQLTSMINALPDPEQVEYIGPILGKEKDSVMQNASVIAFPSRNETFGIVAIEAFSYAKPIIATNTGGLGDIMRESQGGLSTAPGDVTALANALRQLCNDIPSANHYAVAGRAYAEALSWDNIAVLHHTFLEQQS